MTKLQKILLGVTCATALFLVGYIGYTHISEKIGKDKRHAEFNQFIENNNTFFHNTTINGVEIGGMTVDDALEKYKESFESQVIYINTVLDTSAARFVFEHLHLDYSNFENELKRILDEQFMTEEEYYDERKSIARNYTYDLIRDVEDSKVDFESVSFLAEDNIIDSEDAKVLVDVKNGKVSIKEEVYGNRLKPGVFEEKLDKALANNMVEIILTEDDYIVPAVISTDESIQDEYAFYKAIFGKTITLNVCGVTDVLDKEEVKEFYSFDKDNKVVINESKISEYVSSLEKAYNTYGFPRTFHTSTGKDVVIEKNLYGWEINHDATVRAIAEAINSSTAKEKINAKYVRVGKRPVTNEISNTYIEVSIDDQHVWMYKDGECILSSVCVTGELTNPDMWTHKGVYFLIKTATDCVLKGPDYRYDVSYWIYFDRENAIGFHDATWRDPSEFNPQTYNGNGSHGCVNLPMESITTMYNNISMDEPVIVW